MFLQWAMGTCQALRLTLPLFTPVSVFSLSLLSFCTVVSSWGGLLPSCLFRGAMTCLFSSTGLGLGLGVTD